jgi:Zinc binding domain
MRACCTPIAVETKDASPKKSNCPVCRQISTVVLADTMHHHLKAPWQWVARPQGYYFCDTPACSVTYFGEDGETIYTQAVRTQIGIKDASPNALICYCFGVTMADAQANPDIRRYVMAQTKTGACACTTRNPSGLCCLKTFPKLETAP